MNTDFRPLHIVILKGKYLIRSKTADKLASSFKTLWRQWPGNLKKKTFFN